jgi:hypothetical protein
MMSDTIYYRPAVQVGFDWISGMFPWDQHAEDLKEFRDVRKQFVQLKGLQDQLRADLQKLRDAEKAAHAKLAAAPSADTVAKAEQGRRELSTGEAETPRSLKHLDNALDELVRNRLAPVAAKLNYALGEFLISESQSIETQEQALAKKYQASEYLPSGLVKALIYRAGFFFNAAQTIPKMASIAASRSVTPDSCLNGVVPPEK